MEAMVLKQSLVALGALAWAYGCSGGDGGSNASGSGGPTSGAGGTSSGTMTTASSMSTSTSMSTTSTGGGMIMCMSTYSTIPKGECDLLQQDCPMGSVCTVGPDGASLKTVCQPAAGGLKGKGSDCTTNSECKDGLSCIQKHCTPFCCPDNNQPCETGKCDIEVSFNADKNLHANACSYLKVCNLFKGDCPMGTECHLENSMACLSVCDSPAASHVDEGKPCKYRNDCGDSQFCNNNAPDAGVCRYFCDTKAAGGTAAGKGGCPPMRTCKPINSGCMNLGFCSI
jgi:hypothetical protein